MAHFLDDATTAAMRARLAEIFAADPKYRVLHYLLGPARVLEWAHSVGVATDDALAACAAPIPPPELRAIVADSEPEIFLFTGFYDLEQFARLYRTHAIGAPEKPRVLDFGCGCGRMTRYLDMLPSWQAYGSEINRDHVVWCQSNLKNVDTRLNGTKPPLGFDDGMFDLVYSLSIFTHLPEHSATAWLDELARVLKPGGIVILTTHGKPALDTILSSEAHLRMMIRPKEEFIAIRDGFEREPYVFQSYDSELASRAKAGEEYGNSFIHPAKAVTMWSRAGFETLEHIPAGMRAWQDIFVLQHGRARRGAH